jgi:superfamily II DNA or RNA helicase
MKLILREIAENIEYERIDHNWRGFDFESFSKSKKLYDFQKEALENILKILWFYYEKAENFEENESLEVNKKRKEKLFNEYNEYLDYRAKPNKIDFPYKEEKKHKFIFEYYPLENGKISFKNFINRAGFWMATGSGKTLVIIKLIEFLRELIERKEIPDYDILFLTYREDLIRQFKDHLEEYNEERENKILVYDLKDYEKMKRNSLFKENFIFYYRSDLFSDEEKEKEIDFRNKFNDGKWYIILDEAHKGNPEDSKRKDIFSILSKNGFLFNFSATFDDIRDYITTCFEYNLPTFIEKGYGKKIYISDYEIKAFRDRDELNKEEKQKIILKGLILLTYIKKNLEKIREENELYHNPLMMALVHSVNEEDADLELFFDELKNIAEENFNRNLLEEAKNEIIKEFREKDEYEIPEKDKISFNGNIIQNISYQDILNYVFNSQRSGIIEISYNPSVKGEVVFKLQTADTHFALMKTGDMPNWLKNSLNRFNVNHTFEDEKFFENISREDSPINILLGSRVFYEGWDSNRPNIIMFINIGTKEKAKKFVLQSIGRGVRIEPIKDIRKRIIAIKEKIDEDIFRKIRDFTEPIETLFVFGTNKNALETIVNEINEIRERAFKGERISLSKNIEKIGNEILLVPKYREGERRIFEEEVRYGISEDDFNLLKEFNQFIEDDRILLMLYDAEPKLIKYFRNSLAKDEIDERYYKVIDVKKRKIARIMKDIFNFWGSKFKEFEKLTKLKDEIRHFENIQVSIEEMEIKDEFKKKIDIMKAYPNKVKEVKETYYGKLTPEEFVKKFNEIKKSEIFEYQSQKISLKYISEHYYLPLILSENEKIDWIKHIIKTESERKFINDLERYLAQENNKFKEFDWWLFSKIDESLDEIFIPYYDSKENKMKNFKPDFIFWLRKGNNYYIVFVDPKSTAFTSYENKIYWYKRLFEENAKPKSFEYKNLKCYILCILYCEDKDKVLAHGYKNYWAESPSNIAEILVKI